MGSNTTGLLQMLVHNLAKVEADVTPGQDTSEILSLVLHL